EAQVAGAAAFRGDAEVQADRLRVADVQVAVRLGRKPGRDAAVVLAARDIVVDNRTDEVDRRRRSGRRVVLRHLCNILSGALSAISFQLSASTRPATSNQQPPYGSRFHRAAIFFPSSPGTQTTTAFAPDGPVLCRTE